MSNKWVDSSVSIASIEFWSGWLEKNIRLEPSEIGGDNDKKW